ncbi:hypothetical protein Vadar_017054 [Vaccinium darrowii]|uniref:Uncharacterized protein n=1 Tax=Vaccinium darrowii TaxID=229202 RepID=A0ACB7XAB1_9ERIC|nr:hypothetical protein Vadar_017054 [Vaccinium darrowii]
MVPSSDGEGVVLHCMKWGLIPSFTKYNEKLDCYKMCLLLFTILGGTLKIWYPVTSAMGEPTYHGPECIMEEFSLAVGRYQRCLKEIRSRACDYVDEKKGIKITKKEWENQHVHIASYNNFPTAAGLASSAAGFACLDSKLLGSSMKRGEVAENALTVTDVRGNLNQEPST